MGSHIATLYGDSVWKYDKILRFTLTQNKNAFNIKKIDLNSLIIGYCDTILSLLMRVLLYLRTLTLLSSSCLSPFSENVLCKVLP